VNLEGYNVPKAVTLIDPIDASTKPQGMRHDDTRHLGHGKVSRHRVDDINALIRLTVRAFNGTRVARAMACGQDHSGGPLQEF
jgi:hypothetical protein